MISPYDTAKIIVSVLDDKKAYDIKTLKTTDITILTDYFIICTATSSTHIRTLSDCLDEALKKSSVSPRRREGGKNSEWMLIDCGAVVVHIFLEKGREYYKLEHLWNDAEEISI